MALNFINSVFAKPPLANATRRRKPPHAPAVMTSDLSTSPPHSPNSLGVVITGSTKGVGRALAEEFVKRHDRVVISSRTPELVDSTLHSLRTRYPTAKVFGCVADVGKHADVARLTEFAAENLGVINTFICNAGTTGNRISIRDADPNDLHNTVSTNLLGPMYCAKYAQHACDKQDAPLHVFIMDGSGTRGNSTAQFAAYGATKRSIPQLISSLTIEGKDKPIRFHQLSPGMVLTDLLLSENQEPSFRKIFNFLAEEPETVADELVPQIRDVVLADKSNTYIAYLTIPKAFFRLSTGFLLGMRSRKFFDPATGLRIDQSGTFKENGVRIKE